MAESESETEIVVGTYEEFLLGYKLTTENTPEGKKYSLKQSFTNHSHSGSIRAIASVGKFIASGSTDEMVRLLNFSTRTEHGYLQEQNGTIYCLANFGSEFLFSGSEDGTICIWKSGSWQCEKTLKAHQGGVLGMSIHPSGKLALSIGRDRSLKTWNLIKGRTGFITNLKGVADAVQWSPKGTLYAVSIANRVDIYCIQTAKVVYAVPFGKRASSITFPNETVIMVAGDKETVDVHSVKGCAKMVAFEAHKNRVKDIKYVSQLDVLVTASNDGFIKLWGFGQDKSYSKPPTLLTEIDTTCRVTCLAVYHKVKPAEALGAAGEMSASESEEEEDEEDEEDIEEKGFDDDEEEVDEDEDKDKGDKSLKTSDTKKSKKALKDDSDPPSTKKMKKQ